MPPQTVRLGRLELTGRVRPTGRSGRRIACEWKLLNHGSDELAVSFYLRAAPAQLAALVCPTGRARLGHRYGSATLLIPAGTAATVSALLRPVSAGEHPVSMAVVTRHGAFEQTNIVTVRSQPTITPEWTCRRRDENPATPQHLAIRR
jgi:hypothetical protein